MFKKVAEERGGVLLTAQEDISGEVAGGLRAHRWGVGASAQEGWGRAGAQGIPLSKKEGADQGDILEQLWQQAPYSEGRSGKAGFQGL